MERAAAGEMTAHGAVASVSDWLDWPITVRYLYLTRSLAKGSAGRERGRRLVFRREQLDTFLSEFGTDPPMWHAGYSRSQIDELRAKGVHAPQIERPSAHSTPCPTPRRALQPRGR